MAGLAGGASKSISKNHRLGFLTNLDTGMAASATRTTAEIGIIGRGWRVPAV